MDCRLLVIATGDTTTGSATSARCGALVSRRWRHDAPFLLFAKAREAAGFPRRPSVPAAVPHWRAILGRLHRGPISRPYPNREPLHIGAPSALAAEPT